MALPQANRPVVCIFCGGGPLTGEDIWSDWFVEQVGDVRIKRDTGDRTTTRRGIREKRPLVCKTCNNGWMSDIENQASVILKPMTVRDPRGVVLLTKAAQEKVAIWATLKTIVADFAIGKERNINPGFAHHFYSHREPGGAAVVWLAAYGGTDKWAYGRKKKLEETSDPITRPVPGVGTEPVQLYSPLVVTTFTFRRVVFQVATFWGSGEFPFARFDHYGEDIVRIWPLAAPLIGWPPGGAFDDALLEDFAANIRFGPDGRVVIQ